MSTELLYDARKMAELYNLYENCNQIRGENAEVSQKLNVRLVKCVEEKGWKIFLYQIQSN